MTQATKKNISRVLSVLWYAFLLLLALVLVSITVSRARGEVPNVFGFSIMRIASGSMEQEIPTDSYILIRKVAPEDVRKNDIICFYSEDPLILGRPNTHRVVADPIPTEDGFTYVTKGDANALEDKIPARSARLIGRYVKSLPILTAVAGFFTTHVMLVVLIFMQVACVGMVVFTVLKKKTHS